MRNQISRATLASNPGLPADAAEICQRVLAMRADMHPWLAANPAISAPVWHILWGKTRPEAAIAQGLVARELDSAQRNVVITKENRVGVFKTFIAHNALTLEEQKLLSGKANAAAALLEQPWLDPSLRKPLARKIGGLELLREMTLAPEGAFTADELRELILSYPAWASPNNDPRKGAKERNRYLRILFGRRIELISPVVEHLLGRAHTSEPLARCEQDLLTAIAGSAHLDGEAATKIAGIESGNCTLDGKTLDERYYCLLALVNNPRCPRTIVEAVRDAAHARSKGTTSLFHDAVERRASRPDVTEAFSLMSDPETLAWVLRRALPYRGEDNNRPARPIELIELGKNPNLDERQRTSVRNALTENVENELIEHDADLVAALWPNGYTFRQTPPQQRRYYGAPSYVQEAFKLSATQLGSDPVRWETLIGLLDDYDGTFEELVSLSESI